MIVFIRRSSAILILCILALNLVLLATIGGAVQKPKKMKVLLDAGHGAPDGGCVAEDGTQEAVLNLAVCVALRAELEKRGFAVQMTRTTEQDIHESGETVMQRKRSDMQKRKKMRDEGGADLFVSIHMNSFSQTQYHGAQVIYDTKNPQAKAAAICVQNAIREKVDAENKRVPMEAPSTLYLMRAPAVPSVLVECGFLSNTAERDKLKTPQYRERLAAAIAEGIADWDAKKKSGEQARGITTELKR